MAPILIVFGGLPRTGKTAIPRELARALDGVYLRIDSIEQAIRDSGAVGGPLNDVGYRVGYSVAEDNLCLGRLVIADSVNRFSSLVLVGSVSRVEPGQEPSK